MRYFIIILLAIFSFSAFGQAYKKRIEKDTTLTKLLENIPKENQKMFRKMYKKMSPREKELIAAIIQMPRSSKKELISNIDTNYQNIFELELLYNKLVPTGYKIYVEFQPSDKLLNQGESIDLWAWKTDTLGLEVNIFQEWRVELTSGKLDSLLNIIHWDRSILKQIEIALGRAKCISIQNGEPIEIGFSRSGMGKYSYVIFTAKLTEDMIKKFNDGCSYIFYRDGIVLKYGGGAVGPQCFPDRD